MGILKSLFKEIMKAAEEAKFTPDFSKTEYDNWLEFLSKGGSSEEWKALKKQNGWKFKRDPVDKHLKFEKEFRPIFNEYYASLQKIKKDWSVMYNLKEYSGKKAERFERECLHNIAVYKSMYSIETKYGEDHLTAVEGYKRLAMLYERQGNFEKAANVCKEAIQFSNLEDMKGRLAIAIKKAGRTPTAEESALIDK